ncbi:hypothetical protein TVAG_300460 [Trichomonas vaginalis G3]|uniref:Uncharacterized protein n=1 Tax=Trichomonas vaginalis (strain ATCC PRA-98 / G3) TaxID=412133 RepID=A2EP27_TRIV3|nr:hypothetical protein TVAGG3_0155350 [Trichomonas vaginalis G3]EAY05565.1 hypothetical protein TVAG_300460 [Trichomonas vaginalis G3]KAI5547531.1 hypothetical protein TVAGG3_0155350 [Trichomonas vaginalis G3]|eukprot:XP_001317788.1 hypothetical protein [Trichomonas vaginalis G3]
MNETDERIELLEEIRKTNIIPSLKTQLKMALCDKLRNHNKTEIIRSQSRQSEIIDNIVLEYLYKCGFHSTASIFFAESNMHQLPREQILSTMQVVDTQQTIMEMLVSDESHPSILTQTDYQDLDSKLNSVEEELRRKRKSERTLSSEDMLRRGIDAIDNEYELRFQKELANRMDMWRASELSKALSSDKIYQDSELERIQKELEVNLRQKTNEERNKFDKTSEALHAKQRELEAEIQKWAEQNIIRARENTMTTEARAILQDCEQKSDKIQAKIEVLQRKCEKDLRKLEDAQLEHRKSKREVEKLKLSIQLLDQNSSSIIQ